MIPMITIAIIIASLAIVITRRSICQVQTNFEMSDFLGEMQACKLRELYFTIRDSRKTTVVNQVQKESFREVFVSHLGS